jgi:hypothetical protein
MNMRREQLRARAKKLGLYLREALVKGANGVDEIHMRVFTNPKADYYQGGHIYEARSIYRAEAFISGYTAGKGLPPW